MSSTQTEELENNSTKKWFCEKCNRFYSKGYKEGHIRSIKHMNNNLQSTIHEYNNENIFNLKNDI